MTISLSCALIAQTESQPDSQALLALDNYQPTYTLPQIEAHSHSLGSIVLSIPEDCHVSAATKSSSTEALRNTVTATAAFSARFHIYTSQSTPLTGILLENNATLSGCTPDMILVAPNAQRLHAIELREGAQVKQLGGTVAILSRGQGDTYGFVLGDDRVRSEDDVALYNATARDSSGFDIDWSHFFLAAGKAGAPNSAGNSYGIYIAADESLPHDIGGRILAGPASFAYELKDGGRCIALHAPHGKAVGRISGELAIAQMGGSSRAIGYLAGRDFLQAKNSLTLYNAETGDSTGFDIDWDRVSFSVAFRRGTSYGIYLADGETLPITFGGTLKVANFDGQSYGIWMHQDGALERFAGTMRLQHNSEYGYGYALGVGELPKGSSVAFFNRRSKDSSGFTIDWSRTHLSVRGGRERSYGIWLGAGQGIKQALEGSLSVQGDGQVYGIHAADASLVGAIRCPIRVDCLSYKSTTYGYVLGEGVVKQRDSVGLYNAQTADSSGFELDWSRLHLDVQNRMNRVTGIYLGSGKDILGDINARLKIRGQRAVHAIYTHAPLSATLRGSLDFHDDTARYAPSDAYGYLRGVGILAERDNLAFYNATSKDSTGFKIDWRHYHLHVASRKKHAYAIYLTGNHTIDSPLRGKISALSGDARATAISYESPSPLTLGPQAEIRGIENAKFYTELTPNIAKISHSHHYIKDRRPSIAIRNTIHGIHLRAEGALDSPAIFIEGDLLTGEQTLHLENGSYKIKAPVIQAKRIDWGTSRVLLDCATRFEGVEEMSFGTPSHNASITWKGKDALDLSGVRKITIRKSHSYYTANSLSRLVAGSIKWAESIEITIIEPDGTTTQQRWTPRSN